MSENASRDCVFCRIVRGEIPCAKVYESDPVLAFLDIAPVSRGHTLVIPKGHYENLLSTPAEVLAELARHLPIVAGAVVKATGAEGFHLMQLNGGCAGQVVMHLHFHIIPRSGGDNVPLHLPKGRAYAEGEMAKLAATVAGLLNKGGGRR